MARKFSKIIFSVFILLTVFNFGSVFDGDINFLSKFTVFAQSDSGYNYQFEDDGTMVDSGQRETANLPIEIERISQRIEELEKQYAALTDKSSPEGQRILAQTANLRAERTALAGQLSDSKNRGALGIIWDVTKNLPNTILSGIAGTVLFIISILVNILLVPIFALVLGIFGNLIDLALNFTINISTVVDSISSINTTWGMVRDIFNIIFIFALLYIAIGTILRLSSIDMKKMLGTIIIAAIFINFSLFITKALIDVSNIVSYALYNRITNTGTVPISSKLMQGLGLTQGFSPTDTFKKTMVEQASSIPGISKFTGEDGMKIGLSAIIMGVLNLVLMGIVIFAFGSVALLLLARTGILIMLLITSPVAIAGYVLPRTEEYASKWWKALTSQLIVLPIFLLLMTMISSFAVQLGGNLDLAPNANIGILDNLKPMLNYAILITLIIMSVKITVESSGTVGEMVTGALKKGIGLATGVATGGAALAGSALIGGAASKLMNTKAGTYMKEKSLQGGFGGKVASLGLRATSAAQKGTFDIRNTAAGGLVKGKMGIDLGKGTKSSYGGRIDEHAKGYVERIKQSEGLADEKAARRISEIKPAELEALRNTKINEKETELTNKHLKENQAITDKKQQAEKSFDEEKKRIERENEGVVAGERAEKMKKEMEDVEKRKASKMAEIEKEKQETEKKQTEATDAHKAEVGKIREDKEFKVEKAQLSEKIKEDEKTKYSKAKTEYVEKVENKPGDKGYWGFKGGVASATQRKLVADKIRKLTKEKTKEEQQTIDLAKEMKRLQDEENKSKKEEKPKEDKEKK